MLSPCLTALTGLYSPHLNFDLDQEINPESNDSTAKPRNATEPSVISKIQLNQEVACTGEGVFEGGDEDGAAGADAVNINVDSRIQDGGAV